MAITPLCRRLAESPQEVANSNYTKAVLFDIAAKVAMIAAVAISAGFLAVSLGLTPIITLPLGLALIAILGFIGLMPLSSKLQSWANEHYRTATLEQKVADCLGEINNWTEDEVRAYLIAHQIDPAALPIASLAAKKPEAPLTALLPLIARANAWKSIYEESLTAANRNISFENPQGREELLALEFDHKRIGWDILESQALPAAFDYAVALQSILRPTEEISLDQIGVIKNRPYVLRMLDIAAERPQVYFTFNQQEKAPLLLADLLGRIENIRPLVFA